MQGDYQSRCPLPKTVTTDEESGIFYTLYIRSYVYFPSNTETFCGIHSINLHTLYEIFSVMDLGYY